MSYTAALDHLYARGLELAPSSPAAPRRKFDLDHMRILAAAIGDPQKSFPSILIAGTNGKGSTAATLASILTAAGYRTGLYTSPHLSRVNERIQIDGVPISDDDFARLYFQVDSTAERLVSAGTLPHHSSFFETLTALAFLYFAGANQGVKSREQGVGNREQGGESRVPHLRDGCIVAKVGSQDDREEQGPDQTRAVDIAVLEVGLGGRLDATNIVDPLLSIITDISLDHQDYLGSTIAEITREKAGILRLHGTLITLPQHPEANQAIGEVAAALDLHAISAANYTPPAEKLTAAAALYVLLKGTASAVPANQTEAGALAPEVTLPRNRYTLTVGNLPLQVDSPLIGQHQQRNIALAIAAAEELRNPQGYNMLKSNPKSYKISTGAIEKGIRNTRWPGRLELLTFPAEESSLSTETKQPFPESVISTEAKRIGETCSSPEAATKARPPHEPSRASQPNSAPLLLDVAHNPAGAWTLRSVIAHLPESRPRTLIFSCLRDKDLREMAQILLPLFDSSSDRPHDYILFAPIASPRAASLEDLAAIARDLEIPAATVPSLAEALAQARAITPADGLIVATGSVYLVGELRTLALNGGAISA